MDSNFRTRLLLQNSARCDLGSVTLAGSIRNSTGIGTNKMRLLGSYALVYLIDGQGHFKDDLGFHRKLTGGDMLILFPDVAHHYGPGEGESWSEYYVVFDGAIFDLWRKAGLISEKRPVVHLEPIDYWSKRFEMLLTFPPELRTPDLVRSICELQQLLADALIRAPGLVPAYPAWFEESCRSLRGTPEKNVEITKVARKARLSYESFRKQFRQIAGVSPGRYRAVQVMNEACKLIYEHGLTNKEISERLAFCDEFHFAKSFRKIIGISTREFRRQLPHR